MESMTLTIEGMSCAHCEHAVAAALRAVPGVSDAHVELHAGRARVEHEGADPAALEKAVSEAGYSARCAVP
jgi:copper chaperone